MLTTKTPRSKLQALGRPQSAPEALPASTLAGDPHKQKLGKNNQENQTVAEAKNGKNRLTEKPRGLIWEQVNPATWRLVDPDAPQVLTPRSHGQWAAFKTPASAAWVFDVGIDRTDWRVRIRKRGGWHAVGCVADVELAKRIAQATYQQGKDSQ